MALALGLRLPSLRGHASQPRQDPCALPVYHLSTADILDRRNDFAATKVPLGTWFRAMYHLTQSKGGISSIELGRRLGVTQTTAWKIKHKLMQVMMERDAAKRLTGRIEVDDAYLGGERNGGKRGRGSPWQDADRGGGRNHTTRKANPLEVTPGERLPPRRDHGLGDAQFQSRQHCRQ